MKKNNFLFLPFIAVTLIALIFLAAQIPAAKTNPKNLPVAIVNEDNGNMGETIYNNLKDNAPDAVKFIVYDSVTDMKAGMDDRETYGGIVIPEDFSSQIESLQSDDAKAAQLEIYVNEGVNTNIATSMENILKQITEQIGTNVGAQVLEKMQEVSDQMSEGVSKQLEQLAQAQASSQQHTAEQTGSLATMISPVQPDKVTLLANPVKTEVIKVNEVGDFGSVPTSLFVPIWFSSIVGAVLLYLSGTKRNFADRKSLTGFQLVQSLIPIIYGFFTGYLVTWYSTWILGYEFESFNNVAIFISIVVIAFVYMILAATSWFKLPVVGIFALFTFFGLPLIQLVPEMIPSFYSSYVLPWLPIRFLVDGIREILFFDQGIMNHYTNVLLGIAIVGFILLWIKNILVKPVSNEPVE